MLATHADDFVNEVQSAIGDLRPRILLTDYLANGLVSRVLELQKAFRLCSAHLLTLLLLEVLSNDFVCLHVAIVVFLDNVVVFGVFGRLRSV